MNRCEIPSTSPAATTSLGRKMGNMLMPGSVIALTGELGCGKTLLTRGICESLGVPLRTVNSPTFVLVNEYRGRMPVFHLDLYRLGTEADIMELGLADYFQRTSEGIMIIEWAEKIASLLPPEHLLVAFEIVSERKRTITMSADTGDRFRELLNEVCRR